MSWVDSPPAALQGNQGKPEQTNRNSQFAMLYLHVLGIPIPTVKRMVAKEAMQDRPNIHMQKSFATHIYLVNIYHLIIPTHLFVHLLPFDRELHEHKDYFIMKLKM